MVYLNKLLCTMNMLTKSDNVLMFATPWRYAIKAYRNSHKQNTGVNCVSTTEGMKKVEYISF